MQVKFSEPEKMNLLGFFVRDLLRTNLATESSQKGARKLKGNINLDVSGMRVTLIFKDEAVQIATGNVKKSSCKMTGDMKSLLDVALGANYLKFLLSGKIKITGNVLMLLKLIELLRVSS